MVYSTSPFKLNNYLRLAEAIALSLHSIVSLERERERERGLRDYLNVSLNGPGTKNFTARYNIDSIYIEKTELFKYTFK